MAIRNRTRSLVGYGLDNALQNLAPQPIQANRAPLSTDTAAVGAIWCYPATLQVWINDGIVNGASQWVQVSEGGSGTFTSLLVNPGPVTTQGTGAVNISADAVATTVNVGTGAAVKTVALGSSNGASSTAIASGSGNLTIASNAGTLTMSSTNQTLEIISGTGALSISDDAAATTVNIASGAAAKTLNLGSSTTTSATNIIAGTGGILLGAAGIVKVNPTTPTAASPTATVTSNARVISATFTGFTTAAAGTQAYTVVSSAILATSGIFVTITGVQQLVGSVVVNTTNNGGSSVAGNVIVNVWVIN